MRNSRPRVYVETSIYTSLFSKENVIEGSFSRWQIEDLLRRDETQRIEAVTSTLTVIEVNAGKLGAMDARDTIKQYFAHTDRLLIEVDYAVAERTRDLFWHIADQRMTKVPNMNLVHLACALEQSCEVLYTWDSKHLVPLNGIFGIRVEKPKIAGQLSLVSASRIRGLASRIGTTTSEAKPAQKFLK